MSRSVNSRNKEFTMGKATHEVVGINFEFEKDFILVTVTCGPTSDGMLGVQGAHKKTFPKERNASDILNNEIAKGEYLTW